jgi:DNA-binding LacI/PurR family transcriptional regulator/DNA-binding transcriptional regulator YhcF (GntR family)
MYNKCKGYDLTTIRTNGIPKYIQLKDILVNEINSGNYKAGDKFYTEKELMHKYEVSYATVTHAVKDMTKEGYFLRKKSLGTFITEHAFKNKPGSVTQAAETLHINDISHLLDKAETPLSWYAFDQIQKGIINSYNGSINIVSLEEIATQNNINAILINPPQTFNLDEISCNHITITLRQDLKPEFNTVNRDVLISVQELMTYLLGELGHRRIGFIGGNTISYHSLLYAGYEIGLRSYSIPFQEQYAIRGLNGTELDGYKAMNKLLALPNPPTAVFADTSLKALGAMQAIHDAGLTIPDDISIASFGHIPETDSTIPPLTTIKGPFYQMGEKAVELLQERSNNNNENIKTCTLHNTLLKRGSCSSIAENKD